MPWMNLFVLIKKEFCIYKIKHSMYPFFCIKESDYIPSTYVHTRNRYFLFMCLQYNVCGIKNEIVWGFVWKWRGSILQSSVIRSIILTAAKKYQGPPNFFYKMLLIFGRRCLYYAISIFRHRPWSCAVLDIINSHKIYRPSSTSMQWKNSMLAKIEISLAVWKIPKCGVLRLKANI